MPINLICITALLSTLVSGHPFSFLPRHAVERAAERRSIGRQIVDHSSNFLTPLTEYGSRSSETKVTVIGRFFFFFFFDLIGKQISLTSEQLDTVYRLSNEFKINLYTGCLQLF